MIRHRDGDGGRATPRGSGMKWQCGSLEIKVFDLPALAPDLLILTIRRFERCELFRPQSPLSPVIADYSVVDEPSHARGCQPA